ncbi:MAG TPA: cob(I)yrinic acid a,c-diamide adenosyltransferase [Chitinophagales bacterium]|nr:cob(I)yrinic acid a,c-diamide adenosyltransferase [Chitinophagales bacterium]
MKIYTKTGDIGETSLFGGRRVLKSELRIETYGTVDELNSWIGLLRDVQTDAATKELLKEIQDRLFTLGATLAADPDNSKLKHPDLHESDIELLEKAIDKMDTELELLRHFVLPGGHVYVSYCHLARTVCRRAERLCVALHHSANSAGATNPEELIAIKYLNRLSDYLFTLSRKMAKDLNAEEVNWIPRKNS